MASGDDKAAAAGIISDYWWINFADWKKAQPVPEGHIRCYICHVDMKERKPVTVEPDIRESWRTFLVWKDTRAKVSVAINHMPQCGTNNRIVQRLSGQEDAHGRYEWSGKSVQEVQV